MQANLRRMVSRLPLCGMLFAIAFLTTSCIFGEEIDIFAFFGEENLFISISTSNSVSACSNEENSSTFTCAYAGEAGARISTVTLTGGDILFLLLLDPLVLQLPVGAFDIAGSYSHLDEGSNTDGPLAIQTGLASIRADVNRTLSAEPGTQLVVFDLPENAPHTGNFAFNVNFKMPVNTTAVPMKALFTGHVEVDGQSFYPPLMPCVTDMAGVPELSVPLPDGGVITLPLDQVAGCQNTVYHFGAAQTQDFGIFLPLIQNQPKNITSKIR